MQFFVNESFQFQGQFIRGGGSLSISEDQLKAEITRGKHPTKKKERWLSGVLTHCSPADDATAAFITKATAGELKPEVASDSPAEVKDDPDEIEGLRKEFDDLGAAYDRRWGLEKMRNELLKAKKHRGM